MVHLVHFVDGAGAGANDALRAKLWLRINSTAYFPLDNTTVLMVTPQSATALTDEMHERYPRLHVIVMRQRNSWKSFGLLDLAKWLKEVGDEF